jgi:hypothetical protein
MQEIEDIYYPQVPEFLEDDGRPMESWVAESSTIRWEEGRGRDRKKRDRERNTQRGFIGISL